jgi:Flp pilus assembly protein TadG
MKRKSSDLSGQKGFVLVYMAATLTGLLLFTGLAVDSGRAYVVKAQLTKAVDGAALAGARSLNSGNPRREAEKIFRANFPVGYVGTTSVTDPTTDLNFFRVVTNAATGVNTVTVTAAATVPTTFMALANFTSLTVTSSGEATRRMVDLSLVVDMSSSIGTQWPTVATAIEQFITAFDQNNDRLSLTVFGNGAQVLDQMPSSRGFNKSSLISHIPAAANGSTNMVEGLYRGWDELRYVPTGTQSGLRIIVLFTDGASNGVPGKYDADPGTARSIRTWDFPRRTPDPDNQTWDNPHIDALYDTATGQAVAPFNYTSLVVPYWDNYNMTAPNPAIMAAVPSLPANVMSWHTHHRSPGIQTAFPLVTNALTVNGVAQSTKRPLRHFGLYNAGRYPAEVFNINNAARNLVEIIANEARADTSGDYKIRIYTIGMGYLVNLPLGTLGEPSSDILKRMANDPTSLDHNPAQLDGEYFPAPTAADVSAAFHGIQNQILRLSK